MNRYSILLAVILFGPLSTYAQTVIIDENFEDGDFTVNPAWTGDESRYVVNSSKKLQLNAPSDTDKAVITTASSAAFGEWEALIEFDFNPSGSNKARFYIVSDTQELKEDVFGYYIEIGNTSDEVSLYRQDGNSSTKIIDGADNIVDSNPVKVRIKATRDITGIWELFADTTGGSSFRSQGTVNDKTYTRSNFIGLFSDYTSTRSTLFEYDDIKVTRIHPPLEIKRVTVHNNTTIDVEFNLDIDASSVNPSDFSVGRGIDNPDAISLVAPNVVRLSFNSPLPNNRHTLTVNNISDTGGNTISSNSTFSFILFGIFARGDVIINEFMYDPPGGQAEYIELKNTSGKIFNLQNWEIGDNGGTGLISSGEIILEADSFLVISADTTALFNTYGTGPYLKMNSLAALNNSGDVIQLKTNTGAMADSLRYTPRWGGKDVALERRSATTPAIFRENFGNSPDTLGGTPGSSNKVPDDSSPPALLNLAIPDNQTLVLAFSERLNSPKAADISNYSLTRGIGIRSSTVIAADSVRLTLTPALENNISYQLNIHNQEDIFGNTAAVLDTTFTFFEISRADSGEIFINEFTYDPPTGSTEYIELFNLSSQTFDLNGWTLNDNTGRLKTIASSRTVLPPDSFLVLAPDSTLLNNFPDINLLTVGSNFPSLNNGGDDIVIRREDGMLLDSLTYTPSFGGNGTAVERRTTRVSGNFPENFGDAPNGFGTPGSANEVAPDKTPPSFEQLITPDSTTLQLFFSENIDPASAINTDNYTVTPQHSIQLIAAGRDTITLFIEPPLESGETIEVTVNNLNDIFGNTLNSATRRVEYLALSTARPGDLRINEILYSRARGGSEFIELFNVSQKNFDLSGWEIGDAGNITSLEPGTQLRAGEFLVLTDNPSFANSLPNSRALPGFPTLNDRGDAVFIRTGKKVTIDSLFYEESWGGNIPGRSLERIDPLAASNDPGNFKTGTAPAGNTAGMQNSVFEEDTEPPNLSFAKLNSDGNIEIQFSEFIQLTENLTFSNGSSLLNIKNFDIHRGNIITLSAPGQSDKSSSEITVRNLTDVRNNVTLTDKIPVSHKVEPGYLVINEIMFNPLNEPDDNLPDQNEYVELRNTRDFAVSLEGLFIHDEPDENGDIRSVLPVSTQAKWVPAQGFVLLYADMAPDFKESRIAEFFNITSVDLNTILRTDRSSLSLASSDDAVFLADSSGTTVDSVFYDQSWHNPNLIDTRGIALERINPHGPGNDPSNWSSSTKPEGGTPTRENTIFQTSENIPPDAGLSFDPNPFSPDDDGREDHLLINYRLDQPDYLIKVQIYDRYGREVRKLADGIPGGFEGTLIWNGRKDDGTRNRIGIYIVVFEAFNSTSGKDIAFKKTVVLARRLN